MSGDRKPPRLASAERETLTALLSYQRESLVRKVADLDDETAARRLVPTDTTLLWLVRHLARAESLWVLTRFAGEQDVVASDDVIDGDGVAAAVADYRAVCARVDAVVAEHSLDELAAADEVQPSVNLRWILLHLLEETARHAGHADILRELLDGRTGR
jgi:uncharacterized damage-inducible protein DinB